MTEHLLIGLALVDAAACADVLALTSLRDYTEANARRAFMAMQALARDGQEVDPASVGSAHSDAGFASEIAAWATDAVGRGRALRRSIAEVRRATVSREIEQALTSAIEEIRGGANPEEVRAALYAQLAEAGGSDPEVTYAPDMIESALDRAGDQISGKKAMRLATGLWHFDLSFGGLPVGVTTIAAQSGSGKTSLAISLVRDYVERIGRRGPAALFVSLEMTADDIVDRMASHASGVPTGKIGSRDWQESDTGKWQDGIRSALDKSLHIWAPGSASSADILDKARAVRATHGLGLVVVDYDELVSDSGDSEPLRVARICRGLKRITQEFEVPLIMLSQYPKDGANPGRPQNKWLAWSKAKEDVSSMIVHWYWPEHWLRTKQVEHIDGYQGPNHGRLFVTKNRGGVPGFCDVLFYPETSRFVDPADVETRRVA